MSQQQEFLRELQKTAQQQARLADHYLLPRSLSRFSLFFFDHSVIFMLISSFFLALGSVCLLNL